MVKSLGDIDRISSIPFRHGYHKKPSKHSFFKYWSKNTSDCQQGDCAENKIEKTLSNKIDAQESGVDNRKETWDIAPCSLEV